MTAAASPATDLVRYTLMLGDDCLVLSQRLAEWVAQAPELEEDVALANIALDLLGQARALLTYAGQIEGAGRDEDVLAFLREEREFLNGQLVEQPNGDFAVTMARQLFVSAYQHLLYSRLRGCADATLAAIAARAHKEVAYHLDHARQWTVRLGDGTPESHRRMQMGVDQLLPYTFELFEPDAVPRALVEAGIAVDPAGLRDEWEAVVRAVLDEATLELPSTTWRPTGGRRGLHTEPFGHLLATMQHLHRSHPGARW